MNDDTTGLSRPDDAYDALLADLRTIIASGRGRAAAAVNAEIVSTYWHIGERLVREEQGGLERAGYGEQQLARLGRVLSREFGRGFVERSLQNIRQFYLAYPNASALRTELTWTHYRFLMRLDDAQRSFYERVAITGRWSSRELDKQINSMLYEGCVRIRKAHKLWHASARRFPASIAPTRPATSRTPHSTVPGRVVVGPPGRRSRSGGGGSGDSRAVRRGRSRSAPPRQRSRNRALDSSAA
jgi:hypothetical protein